MKKFAMAASGGILLGAIATTQIAGPLIAQEAQNNASVYEQLDLFGDVFERIRSEYVEEADETELIEAAIDGMLSSLDPHSSYLSPEDAAEMREQTRGEFGGLGIEVTQEDLNQALMQEAQRYPGQEQAVIKYYTENPDAVQSLRAPIFEDKVVDFVLELAQVEDKPVTPEELRKDPDAEPEEAEQKPAKKSSGAKKKAASTGGGAKSKSSKAKSAEAEGGAETAEGDGDS